MKDLKTIFRSFIQNDEAIDAEVTSSGVMLSEEDCLTLMDRAANQRVIEELKLLRLQAHVYYEGDGFDEVRKIDVEDIESRIKELKQ